MGVVEDGCPKCGALSFYLSFNNFLFDKKTLKNDFYQVDNIKEKNKPPFPINSKIFVFSSKLLTLIIENKIKGLAPYYIKPNPVVSFPELKYL